MRAFYNPFMICGAAHAEDFEAFLHYADKLATHLEKGREKTVTMKFYDALQMDPLSETGDRSL